MWEAALGFVLLSLYWLLPAILVWILVGRKHPVGSVPAQPDQVLDYLAYRLHLAGYRLERAPDHVSVRLGNTSAVKLLAVPSPAGTEVRYQPDATKSGWGTIAMLLILFWTSVAALGVVLVVIRRARRFVQSQVESILPKDGTLIAAPAPDDVSVLLVNGLAEEHRLAVEAYEAQRARYWDLQGLNVLLAMFLGLGVFYLAFSGSSEPNLDARVLSSLQIGVLVALAFAIPAGILLRLWYRPAVLRFRESERRIRAAWTAEVARPRDAADVSSFEALAKASEEIPNWITAIRRAGLSRDPAAGFVILALVFVVYEALSYLAGFVPIIPFLPWALVLVVATALLAVAAAAGGYLYYKRWERARDKELEAVAAEWTARYENLQRRMEQFLDGL